MKDGKRYCLKFRTNSRAPLNGKQCLCGHRGYFSRFVLRPNREKSACWGQPQTRVLRANLARSGGVAPLLIVHALPLLFLCFLLPGEAEQCYDLMLKIEGTGQIIQPPSIQHLRSLDTGRFNIGKW